MTQPIVIIIMGVSGSGKSTVGAALASDIGWHFHDADHDHPPENIQRMRSGQPLTDFQRQPWLQVLAKRIESWLASDRRTVLACSALTRNARRQLHGKDDRVRFVYLRGDAESIRTRMAERSHFMPSQLLDSQFQVLEEPASDEHCMSIDATLPPSKIVHQLRNALLADVES